MKTVLLLIAISSYMLVGSLAARILRDNLTAIYFSNSDGNGKMVPSAPRQIQLQNRTMGIQLSNQQPSERDLPVDNNQDDNNVAHQRSQLSFLDRSKLGAERKRAVSLSTNQQLPSDRPHMKPKVSLNSPSLVEFSTHKSWDNHNVYNETDNTFNFRVLSIDPTSSSSSPQEEENKRFLYSLRLPRPQTSSIQKKQQTDKNFVSSEKKQKPSKSQPKIIFGANINAKTGINGTEQAKQMYRRYFTHPTESKDSPRRRLFRQQSTSEHRFRQKKQYTGPSSRLQRIIHQPTTTNSNTTGSRQALSRTSNSNKPPSSRVPFQQSQQRSVKHSNLLPSPSSPTSSSHRRRTDHTNRPANIQHRNGAPRQQKSKTIPAPQKFPSRIIHQLNKTEISGRLQHVQTPFLPPSRQIQSKLNSTTHRSRNPHPPQQFSSPFQYRNNNTYQSYQQRPQYNRNSTYIRPSQAYSISPPPQRNPNPSSYRPSSSSNLSPRQQQQLQSQLSHTPYSRQHQQSSYNNNPYISYNRGQPHTPYNSSFSTNQYQVKLPLYTPSGINKYSNTTHKQPIQQYSNSQRHPQEASSHQQYNRYSSEPNSYNQQNYDHSNRLSFHANSQQNYNTNNPPVYQRRRQNVQQIDVNQHQIYQPSSSDTNIPTNPTNTQPISLSPSSNLPPTTQPVSLNENNIQAESDNTKKIQRGLPRLMQRKFLLRNVPSYEGVSVRKRKPQVSIQDDKIFKVVTEHPKPKQNEHPVDINVHTKTPNTAVSSVAVCAFENTGVQGTATLLQNPGSNQVFVVGQLSWSTYLAATGNTYALRIHNSQVINHECSNTGSVYDSAPNQLDTYRLGDVANIRLRPQSLTRSISAFALNVDGVCLDDVATSTNSVIGRSIVISRDNLITNESTRIACCTIQKTSIDTILPGHKSSSFTSAQQFSDFLGIDTARIPQLGRPSYLAYASQLEIPTSTPSNTNIETTTAYTQTSTVDDIQQSNSSETDNEILAFVDTSDEQQVPTTTTTSQTITSNTQQPQENNNQKTEQPEEEIEEEEVNEQSEEQDGKLLQKLLNLMEQSRNNTKRSYEN